MHLPTLRTARLALQPWTLDDVDRLHALWIDPHVRRYLWDDVTISRERAEETVREAVDAVRRDGVGQWIVEDPASRHLAGFCGLIRREPGDDPELMYGLAPAFWGRGFATEAAAAVLAHVFGTLAVERVTAATDAPNTASVRVMERLGMRFVRRGTLNGLDTLFYEIRSSDLRAPAGTARR
jgi:ribosomal-protein-alanine N-acetyltransferase